MRDVSKRLQQTISNDMAIGNLEDAGSVTHVHHILKVQRWPDIGSIL